MVNCDNTILTIPAFFLGRRTIFPRHSNAPKRNASIAGDLA
jgi:hypothetical protein